MKSYTLFTLMLIFLTSVFSSVARAEDVVHFSVGPNLFKYWNGVLTTLEFEKFETRPIASIENIAAYDSDNPVISIGSDLYLVTKADIIKRVSRGRNDHIDHIAIIPNGKVIFTSGMTIYWLSKGSDNWFADDLRQLNKSFGKIDHICATASSVFFAIDNKLYSLSAENLKKGEFKLNGQAPGPISLKATII